LTQIRDKKTEGGGRREYDKGASERGTSWVAEKNLGERGITFEVMGP